MSTNDVIRIDSSLRTHHDTLSGGGREGGGRRRGEGGREGGG